MRDFINDGIAPSPNMSGTWFQLAICLRATDEVVGDLGLRFPHGDPEQVEVGITLSPDYQGSGYATEALSCAFGYVFETLHKHRVFASVDPENRASIRLLERLGMRREAHHVQSFWFKGRWADDLLFALLAREWRARNH